ncbi:MAG: putative porin [Paludibacteraceae bacterium]|nr:putative porin [Paludibacteraceae bacterium]
MKIFQQIHQRWISTVVLIICMTVGITANDKTVPTVIQAWQLDTWTGVADTLTGIDSAYLHYPMRNVLNNYSISNTTNSNLISPTQSRIYFNRQKTTDFLFADAYTPYIITPQQVKFYHTTTPYSTIAYKKGFVSNLDQNDLSFSFTGNVNRRTNLGMTIDYLNSYGRFTNQEGKTVFGSVFGSYNGDHYSLQSAFTWNTLSNFENGGLLNINDLQGTLKPEDMPVRMQGMSALRYLSGYLNHYYSICVERERKINYRERNEFGEWEKKDSIKIEYIPVTTFRHIFEVNDVTKRYVEKTANQGFYPNTYYNQQSTMDSAACLTIKNTLSVTFEEEFNTLLKFGATVYAMNECQRHTSLIPIFSDSVGLPPEITFDNGWTNNTYIGGALYKNKGKYIHYGVDGNVCLVGRKLGEFQVNGHLDAGFKLGKDSMTITANAFFRNETPDFYLQQYRSNHYQWDNQFNKQYRLRVGGEIAYPTQWIKPKLNVSFENITQHIYFDFDGTPKQMDGNIQVLAADLQFNITTPWVNLDNSVVYQMSSSDKLPLPTLTLYNNLYYHGTWVKVLDVQIGVDMRFFTKYYAPILNPALGQFCVQNETKIGNYPVMNAYANFYVRKLRLKLFAQYQHFNASFMNKQYFEMPNYPMAPDMFRAGLAWHFYK